MSKASTTGLFLPLGLIWGGSFVAIEVGLTDFPPLLFVSCRFYIAGTVILGYAFVSTEPTRSVRRAGDPFNPTVSESTVVSNL